MRSLTRLAFIAGLIALSSGCAMIAPNYSPSLETVQKIKDSGTNGVKVGSFESKPGPDNPAILSLRANAMESPVGASYSLYLAEAIKQELTLAGKLKPDAGIEISGVLTKNSISIGSFVTGTGEMEARFIVKNAGQITFDKVVSSKTQWESSFAGAIAIPRGHQEYPRLVQSLIRALVDDRDFLAAIK